MSSATHSGQLLLPIHDIDSNEKFQDFAKVISQIKERQPALSTFSSEAVAYFLVKQANLGHNPKAINVPGDYDVTTEDLLNDFYEFVHQVTIAYKLELINQKTELDRQGNGGYEVALPIHEHHALKIESEGHQNSSDNTTRIEGGDQGGPNYAEIGTDETDPNSGLYDNIGKYGEVLPEAGLSDEMLEFGSGGAVASARADINEVSPPLHPRIYNRDKILRRLGRAPGNPFAEISEMTLNDSAPATGGAAQNDVAQTNPFLEPSSQDIGPINTSGYAEFSEAELKELLSGATPATGGAATNQQTVNPLDQRQDMPRRPIATISEDGTVNIRAIERNRHALGQNRRRSDLSTPESVQPNFSDHQAVQSPYNNNPFGNYDSEMAADNNPFGNYDPVLEVDNNPFSTYPEQNPGDRRVQDPLLAAARSRGQAPQLVQGGPEDLQSGQGRGAQSSYNPYAEDLQRDQRRGTQSSYNPYAERGPQSSSHNPYAEALTPRSRSGSQGQGSR